MGKEGKSLEEQLAERGFESVSVGHRGADRASADANVVHPVSGPGEEPLYAAIPVALDVKIGTDGLIEQVAGGTPSAAAVDDARRFIGMLRTTGQLVEEGKPALAAARPAQGRGGYRVVRDQQGRRVVRRQFASKG